MPLASAGEDVPAAVSGSDVLGWPPTSATPVIDAPWLRPGADETEVTVYKAMGVAMEDMVVANLAYRRALEAGIGGAMPW